VFFTRMKFARYARSVGLVALGILSYFAMMHGTALASDASTWVYIGTYTGPKSQGIYAARLDSATGKLSDLELAAKTANPSFLAIHPTKRFLYAVGETSSLGGKKEGAVTAFGLEAKTGRLTLLNQQASGGGGPCHLAIDRSGKWVLVANYGTGSIAVLPIAADGQLAEAKTVIQHRGSSINPQRQAGPHAHFITTDPANRLVLACDLGLDKVLVYRLDAANGSLTENDPPFATVKPGSGPRHLAFHPKGRWVYLVNEMASTMTAFEFAQGALKELQTISTLPEEFRGNNTCAEVQVSPSGKFVYGSNRGHDSIAVFAIDPSSGKLSFVEHQFTQGKAPRYFGIDPTGQWLLAANQDSNSIVVFHIDAKTGRLTPTGQVVEIGSPVCLAFTVRTPR
jgi:6-phosphogluconolactonase